MAEKLTERTTVRACPRDYALICELGRRRGMDTATLLRSVAVAEARRDLPTDAVARIERRFGGERE
jgi:hypothetical protein